MTFGEANPKQNFICIERERSQIKINQKNHTHRKFDDFSSPYNRTDVLYAEENSNLNINMYILNNI